MEYLTVGTREIKRELFVPVSDRDDSTIKPRGGMWFTEYDYKDYSPWVDYIIANPNLLFYKNRGDNIWEQPCSIITLNNNANIFLLDNYEAWRHLIENFPYSENKFSYQKLSTDYDGIFVNIGRQFNGNISNLIFHQFRVSSLILFNLDCINYYQSGVVNISPFDVEYPDVANISYEIECEGVKRRIR